jgi:L-ascorbate metabolism protein UlaG (beta-lactamase superfamily)
VILPLLADDAFLSDVERPLPEGALRVWWLGQSGFLVRTSSRRLLLDPYLSDSLTEKYATTDKPHVRLTARVIAPERLRKIDVVTSSHNHTDHLDADTLRPLLAANPEMKLIIPEANREFVAQRLSIPSEGPIGLDDGRRISVSGFEVHGIAAAHNDLERDEAGRHRFLGYVIRAGRWTLFHSGDTLLYPGLAEKLRAFAPIDVALLPINGNKPERRVAGNLDGAEAARLAYEIGARCVVPCHYEMFAFNTADPRELFVPECERLGQPCRVLRAGESLTLPE